MSGTWIGSRSKWRQVTGIVLGCIERSVQRHRPSICPQELSRPPNLVSEVWRGAESSVRIFPTEDVLARGHVFGKIIIESYPYKVERRFVRKSEIQMPDACSCYGDTP